MLTVGESASLIRKLLKLGARRLILKSDAGSDVIQVIGALRRGQPYFTPNVARLVLRSVPTFMPVSYPKVQLIGTYCRPRPSKEPGQSWQIARSSGADEETFDLGLGMASRRRRFNANWGSRDPVRPEGPPRCRAICQFRRPPR